ncbi:MAG: hypothetical protein AMK72_04625 [Planctomycetes bacterium SM23_25]|nr:MAG: hypothetical protein AMK72_04625 [Planctomycetes bacterium SM23_25]
MPDDLPLLEPFADEKAIIEPSEVVSRADVPDRAVICFYDSVIKKVIAAGPHKEFEPIRTAMGILPVYEIERNSERLLVFQPGIGAPLVVAVTEEIIARGCRKLIALGGAGVLDRALIHGHLVVPTAAIRDEGTSFHYAPASREIAPSEAALAAIQSVLCDADVPFTLGKTWTTDAFYRETPSRIARRKAEGCLTVEMEAAALFALARFRGVILAQMLFCCDDVSGDRWDDRAAQPRAVTLEAAFELAAEACMRL